MGMLAIGPMIFGKTSSFLEQLCCDWPNKRDHGHVFVADIRRKVNYVDCKTFAAGSSASPWRGRLCPDRPKASPFEAGCRFGAARALTRAPVKAPLL
jgi:hypothetical protein